jgi:putative membrane protein insertion efficiency factor
MQIISLMLKIMAIPLLLIIRGYQVFISPFLGQNCRFYPSCSCYAHEALQKHGVLKGTVLSIKRIVKCQPLHPGGIDLVPDNGKTDNTIATLKDAHLEDVNTKI